MSWQDSFGDNLRRQHLKKQQQRKTGGGKGKKFDPFEMEKVTFEPKEDFFLRILRPTNGRVYTRPYHWPAGGFPHTCTRDIDIFDEKCVWCHYYPDKNDRAKRKEVDVLEVIDFRYFHIVPHPTRDGRETVVRCTHEGPHLPDNVRCPHCRSNDERERVRHFGGHKVLEMNQDQYSAVWAAHEALQNYCIHLDAEGKPCTAKNYPVSYVCRGCEHEFLDMDQINSMSVPQLSKVIDHKQKCPECGTEEFPFAIYQCDNGGRTPLPSEIEAATNGEPPPDADHWVVRGSMFDQVLNFRIQTEDKQIGDKMVTLKKFQISTQGSRPDDWSSVAEDLRRFDLTEEQIEEVCKPWDLDHRYRPEFLKRDDGESDDDYVARVLDKQAEAIGQPNPYSGAGGGRKRFGGGGGFRNFGG